MRFKDENSVFTFRCGISRLDHVAQLDNVELISLQHRKAKSESIEMEVCKICAAGISANIQHEFAEGMIEIN